MTEQYDLKDFFAEDDVEGRLEAQAVMDELCVRERRILYLYVTGHTQAQIADIMGLTQQRVQQILANICKRGS